MRLLARRLLTLLLLGACACAAPDSTAFEPEIRAFEAADRSMPPQPGGVVFVGSSSIKNWTNVAADFPGVRVLNRGFGGSTLTDVVHYEDRIVLAYRPQLVVLYAGDNDLAQGRTPEQIVADYRAFVARLRSALPATRLAFISIKPSPSRRALMALARQANQRIRSEIASDSLTTYVDAFTPMLTAAGEPRPELFEGDSLHMNRAGYLLWRSLLEPLVLSSEHASSSDLTGSWTVSGHRLPGISAMTDAQAAAWHGRRLRVTATEATSDKDHCEQPKYTVRTEEKNSFLAQEYKLQPASLAALAAQDRLSILEVSCHGAPWAAVGARLIEIDADHALAPWDGVFFELSRERDAGAPVAAEAAVAACRSVAAWWRGVITPRDSGEVTATDSVLVPPLEKHPTAVCQVQVRLPHGMREARPGQAASDDSVPPALQRSGGDWRRLIEYDADGPDGSQSGYQRGQVRCTVAQSWDGGDDSDSASVTEKWYREELTCWAEPRSDNGASG